MSDHTKVFCFDLPIKGRNIQSFYPVQSPDRGRDLIALAISFEKSELNRFSLDVYQSLIVVDLDAKKQYVDARVN